MIRLLESYCVIVGEEFSLVIYRGFDIKSHVCRLYSKLNYEFPSSLVPPFISLFLNVPTIYLMA